MEINCQRNTCRWNWLMLCQDKKCVCSFVIVMVIIMIDKSVLLMQNFNISTRALVLNCRYASSCTFCFTLNFIINIFFSFSVFFKPIYSFNASILHIIHLFAYKFSVSTRPHRNDQSNYTMALLDMLK